MISTVCFGVASLFSAVKQFCIFPDSVFCSLEKKQLFGAFQMQLASPLDVHFERQSILSITSNGVCMRELIEVKGQSFSFFFLLAKFSNLV